jgi:hypothetical protein
MGFMGRKSKLNSKLISKVWLNKKDYIFQDFEFKVVEPKIKWQGDFDIDVYNVGTLILTLNVMEWKNNPAEKKFKFEVTYFNPQTDNDCFSINHIIAVSSNYIQTYDAHKDLGNAEVLKNQYIFRKRKSYYTYTRIWTRGDIREENYDQMLSYEFATDEYVNYIKKIFKMKKIPRKRIKTHIRGLLDKLILVSKL